MVERQSQLGMVTVLYAVTLCMATAFPSLAAQKSGKDSTQAEELFAHRVLAIFRTKCFSCHGDDATDIRGKYNMQSREGLLKGGESEDAAIVPGRPEQSPLYKAVIRDGLEMPPKENDRLSAEQAAYIKDWIKGGAPWPDRERLAEIVRRTEDKWNVNTGITVGTSGGLSDDWTKRKYLPENLWAYQPLWKDESGRLKNSAKNPIDVLIEDQLTTANIKPLRRADRRTLIRRLTFDLTGLPPTPVEIDSFLADESKTAFEQCVARLLDSPHYGEQWGRHWLDVVRYADSAGFSNDFLRANAWRYRDYVIRSFNNDKPYDQFVREQIAGDELNPDDPESLIAVGFLRMGPWEHTSMSVAAVTRQQFLDDITNNVGVTFLGHELRCASCHDHKFDPIPTRDYYSMQAVFAPVQFADRTVPYQPCENVDGFAQREARIVRLQKAGGVKSLSTIPKEEWPVPKWDADTEGKGHGKVNNKRKQILDRELKRFKRLAFSVYSGRDRPFLSNRPIIAMPSPAQRRGTPPAVHILTGGSVETPGQLVSPAVLSVVTKDAERPVTQELTGRRAALAEWLTSPRNPLTARVMVNRVWQYHFGQGLAGNPNNFGATGKKPTHPKLLDFLADYFIANGWSLKKLHRLIVSSETWQRTSGPVPEQTKQRDPDNQLYSHFTPRRLSAEELRDSMLFVTGELNRTQGGLPVRPEINMEIAMQPRHIMGSVAPAWQPSRTPAERNRRTIYTERIRTLRDPMMEVFNQPGLDTSCERRDASTITPQAFTLFNSRNSFDRSLALANQLKEVSTTGKTDEQLALALRKALGRNPTVRELARCKLHYTDMLRLHKEREPRRIEYPKYVIREMVEEMTGLTFYWVEDLDMYRNYVPDLKPWDVPPEVRAMADVCLVLFNSNEFIYVY
jgi:mono/diheme cytochrome c family protein